MQLLYVIYCFLLSCLSDLLSSISRSFFLVFPILLFGGSRTLVLFYCCSRFRPSAVKHVQHEYLCEQSTRLVYQLSLFEGQAFCHRHMSGVGLLCIMDFGHLQLQKKKKKIHKQTLQPKATLLTVGVRERKNICKSFIFFFYVFV